MLENPNYESKLLIFLVGFRVIYEDLQSLIIIPKMQLYSLVNQIKYIWVSYKNTLRFKIPFEHYQIACKPFGPSALNGTLPKDRKGGLAFLKLRTIGIQRNFAGGLYFIGIPRVNESYFSFYFKCTILCRKLYIKTLQPRLLFISILPAESAEIKSANSTCTIAKSQKNESSLLR